MREERLTYAAWVVESKSIAYLLSKLINQRGRCKQLSVGSPSLTVTHHTLPKFTSYDPLTWSRYQIIYIYRFSEILI